MCEGVCDRVFHYQRTWFIDFLSDGTLYMKEHYFCEYFVRDLGYMCRVRLSLGLERIQGVPMQIIRIKLELLKVI